jgi:hypothetical protein
MPSSVQRNHGRQKKSQFSAKIIAAGRKNDFFLVFSFSCTCTYLRLNYLVFINSSYLQPFREIMGGQKASRTNNEQTNTTDDHNSPSGFTRILGSILTPLVKSPPSTPPTLVFIQRLNSKICTLIDHNKALCIEAKRG